MSLDSKMDPLGQRERRKAESRERLIETARNVFVERGCHGTRLADIAEAADLAIGARLQGGTGFENRMHAACEAVLNYAARSSSPIEQPEATHDPCFSRARSRRHGDRAPREGTSQGPRPR